MQRASFSFSKNRRVPIASFATVAFIFALVIISEGVYPFGDRCILRTDMYHQYAPFFAELKTKLSGSGSLFFSWDLGLGVNFLAVIAYYLASPLNLLLLFVPETHIIEFMTVLIVAKSGLAAAAMAVYLTYREPGKPLCAYIVSLFYGLSGYICAYYWNLMWLDAIFMFPLVIMGLERLIKGRSGLMYGLCLGAAIFTNYYISIPICIFSVIYFFLFSFLEGAPAYYAHASAAALPAHPASDIAAPPDAALPAPPDAALPAEPAPSPLIITQAPPSAIAWIARNFARFVFCSLLAGGLAAVLILPEVYNFTLTASSSNTFPTALSEYFSILSELFRQLPFTETEQGLDHWPNIYAGTFAVPFFFLYLYNRRIALREKLVYIILCLFFLMSFAVNVLNFLWHGLHYPNSLPARQSFIYIFLVLFVCHRVLTNLRAVGKRDILKALGFSAAFVLLAEHLATDDAFSIYSFYPALILVFLYMGVLYAYRSGVLKLRPALFLVAVIAVSELAANTAYTSVTTTSRTSFTADNAAVKELVEKAAAEDTGSAFYRIERAQRKSKNDGAWLSFPSASFFSSTVNADMTSFFKSLGMEASTNAYSITGSTELCDMLFGIKYTVSSSAREESAASHILAEEDGMYLYANTYALGPVLAVPEALFSEWMRELSDPALVQNSLADALKTSQILIPVYAGGSSEDGEFAVTISESGIYYAYEGEPRAGDITVRWSDRKKTYTNLDRKYFMELGVLEKGELLDFAAEEKGIDPKITIYRLSQDALSEIYEALSVSELTIEEVSDGYLKGVIDVDTEALGYTSSRARVLVTVPYDGGWSVSVDGERVETQKTLDAFLGFYITGGTHEVVLSFRPMWFVPGLWISILSALAFPLVFIFSRRRKKGGESAPGEPDLMPPEQDPARGEIDTSARMEMSGGEKSPSACEDIFYQV